MPNSPSLLELLKTRRSTATASLTEPGPSTSQLEDILTIGLRVPDHGKLEPWRLIVVEGSARQQLGQHLAKDFYTEKDKLTEKQQQKLTDVITRSVSEVPLIIYVVSHIEQNHHIPEVEQLLSAGAVCMNIILAATAYGYGTNWISGWLANSSQAKKTMGIKENEQIAGIIFIGTISNKSTERKRPDLAEKVSYWTSEGFNS